MRVHVPLLWISSAVLLVACAPSPDSSLAANKEIARQFVAAYNAADFDRLDQFMKPDVIRHSQSTAEVSGIEAVKAALGRSAQAFPDAREEIHTMIAEGDKVLVYATWTATQTGPFGPLPATGKVARVRLFYLFRIAEGQIAEFWTEWDNLNMLRQLGHYPS